MMTAMTVSLRPASLAKDVSVKPEAFASQIVACDNQPGTGLERAYWQNHELGL